MLRNKPRFSYNGLTVVLSNPSRLDKASLLSANGGQLFNELLRPEFNTFQCDIRVKEDRSELLPNTKCVLLCGEPSAQLWLSNSDNKIGELRGSVFSIDSIPHIPTFFPQDCVDIKDFE